MERMECGWNVDGMLGLLDCVWIYLEEDVKVLIIIIFMVNK